MKFIKMHGNGNDYIYVNCLHLAYPLKDKVVKMCDPHFGIGGDGVVLLETSKTHDFKMTIYNKDGSLGNTCGNALRCLGYYIYQNQLTSKNVFTIETSSSSAIIYASEDKTIVDMNKVSLIAKKFPVTIDETTFDTTILSLGNPHCVIFVDDIKQIDVAYYGPRIEKHPVFHDGINVEFVEVIDSSTIKMRVWERGSGETLSCGSGACASAYASLLHHQIDLSIHVETLGGILQVEYNPSNQHIYLSGDTKIVFEGEYYENQ